MAADDLESYIVEARRTGAVRVRTPEGEVYVVAPRVRAAGPASPFVGADTLLQPPLARAAYSDRTAWLMATLSELAYRPFEKDDAAREELAATLSDAGLLLVECFDAPETGTQAFLARRPGAFSVLAFRGTEKDRKDILVDLNARFYETPAGKAHHGFSTAYAGMHGAVEAALSRLPRSEPAEQLFITGHSLGGALATTATKLLESRFVVGACYTFGSPRVGTPEWSDAVKTPVYRVVNGADGVPLVPGGTVMRWCLTMLPNVPFLTWLEKPIQRFVSSGYVGFQHVGDLRYIHDKAGQPHLKIGSAAVWGRFRHVVFGKIGGAIVYLRPGGLSSTFKDHGIGLYASMLRRVAEARNPGDRPGATTG